VSVAIGVLVGVVATVPWGFIPKLSAKPGVAPAISTDDNESIITIPKNKRLVLSIRASLSSFYNGAGSIAHPRNCMSSKRTES